MDPIEKALQKLQPKERERFKRLLRRIQSGVFSGLDIRKLKDRDDIYRVRKGSWRIIFHATPDGPHILSLERRNDTTYR